MCKILKNRTIILSFAVLLLWGIWSCFTEYKGIKDSEQYYASLYEECSKDINYMSSCEYFLENYNSSVYKPDVFALFYEVVVLDGLTAIAILGPLFILVPSVWVLSKEVKSLFVKNFTMRNTYKNYLKHLFMSAYKCIWILPTVMIVVFVLCGFITNWNLDYSNSITNGIATFEIQYLEHFAVFFVIYLINLVFFSIFYANLSLIFMKKSKSIILTIIEAYLLFIGIDFVGEAFSSLVLSRMFNMRVGSLFNILDIYSYENVIGAFPYLCVGFACSLISGIVVYILYKNKEDVIIAREGVK